MADLAARMRFLVSDYDKKWCALDFAGLADLWERDNPPPTYVAEEYAAPLIGADDLDRHWARVASRLKAASVSSQVWSADEFSGGLARCVLLSRWSYTGQESEVTHTGTSWITWLLTLRNDTYLIVHHAETQVYLEENVQQGPGRGRTTSPDVSQP